MPKKNVASTVRFFVQDTYTGLGVPSLTTSDFSSIKLSQDGTIGADIKGSITLVNEQGGWYNFATSAAQMNYGYIVPVATTTNITYQTYGVTTYTQDPSTLPYVISKNTSFYDKDTSYTFSILFIGSTGAPHDSSAPVTYRIYSTGATINQGVMKKRETGSYYVTFNPHSLGTDIQYTVVTSCFIGTDQYSAQETIRRIDEDKLNWLYSNNLNGVPNGKTQYPQTNQSTTEARNRR